MHIFTYIETHRHISHILMYFHLNRLHSYQAAWAVSHMWQKDVAPSFTKLSITKPLKPEGQTRFKRMCFLMKALQVPDSLRFCISALILAGPAWGCVCICLSFKAHEYWIGFLSEHSFWGPARTGPAAGSDFIRSSPGLCSQSQAPRLKGNAVEKTIRTHTIHLRCSRE